MQPASASPPPDAILEVRNLSHGFGQRQVLRNVSVRVSGGRVTVLLGLNGAGKTTLFSLITRLYNPRPGKGQDNIIRVFGEDLRIRPGRALAQMGVVFQQPTLDPDLTVMQNLRYHGGLHGLSARTIAARAVEELERIGLADRANEPVRTLSGGQRRRVEIARALLHRPSLLLLDEPTVGLDPALRQQVVAHVHALARERGLAVLWATHLMDEADRDDDVVVLHQGRVLADGRISDLVTGLCVNSLAEAFARLTLPRDTAGDQS